MTGKKRKRRTVKAENKAAEKRRTADETTPGTSKRVRKTRSDSSLGSKSKEKIAKDTKSKATTKNKETRLKIDSPFTKLIAAAKLLNPREFKLPRELTMHIPFPGTVKGICFFFYFLSCTVSKYFFSIFS